MEKEILLLEKKFKEIKDKGYIKTVRNGSTGIGATFESLLGKPEESFEIPDFYGIEIKTRRAYSKSKISLFNAVPTGSSYYEVKRLRDKYGYPSKKDKRLKCLYADVEGTKLNKVGLWYYFKLKIDEKQERLILEIYNYRQELIDDTTYWDFYILKEKILRKLQVLALIKAMTNHKEGIEYFKYYKMNIYILKDFETFIKLIKEGKIIVTFKIDSYTNNEYGQYGNVDSHGISFGIKEENILDLFDIYR